jgi:alginate O-acetyltransferase complex protein AlgI
MVFGDSQLEGDRFTMSVRSGLRKLYGGTGPGLLQPLMPVMFSRAYEVRSSSNWRRYNYLSYRDGTLPHRQIGPFMSVCRFLPPDSVTGAPVTATVRITPSPFADRATSTYDNLRIFYGNLTGTCTVAISTASGEIARDTLIRGTGPNEFSSQTYGVSDLRITFRGEASPDIFAFSIEGDTGVVVDNIPHRGSAGLEFTMADRTSQREILSLLNPKIIVLQYGLNVVKNVRNDYTYYQRGIERQITLLREISPGTGILLMSLTDMAGSDSGRVASYTNIPKIRDAQKRAAESAGVAFWDTFDAMGGENSIVEWVDLNPPLAQKDYTHLTYAGSDLLAKMLLADMLRRTDTLPEAAQIAVADTLPGTDPFQIAVADTLPGADQLRIAPADTLPGADQLRIGPADTLLRSDASQIEVAGTVTPAGLSSVPTVLPQSTSSASTIVRVLTPVFTYRPDSPFIFTNIAFWAFLLVLMAGYSIVYKNRFIRNFYLFLFSLFFYYKSGGFFLFLLIISTVTDYTAARLIHRSGSSFVRRFWLIISLIVNLGMLAYFKYYGFIIDSLNNLAGTSIPAVDILASLSNDLVGTSFNISSVILPVGISFFTFQTISYTVDVYRSKIEPVRNIIDFGFYVSFFPQLVAGPIVRASEFIPQLYDKYSLSKREFGHAVYTILKGLIKKMVISDYISVNFVDRVFDAPELYSGAENLLSVYGYGLQIYCDFSGYTDIAIGVGLLLGFRLPFNFNSPYKATGVADFWRRWHISLSRWLRDYLYISLGGNRKGTLRTGINLLITMTLGGLWHGASGRFVIWGVMHGLGLIVNKIWGSLFPSPQRKRKIVTLLQIILTFNFVSFTWIFFRAESNSDAMLMIRKIFTAVEVDHLSSLWQSYSAVIMVMITGYIFHFLPGRVKESGRGLFVQSPVALQLVIVVCVVLLLLQMSGTGIQPFIYFRF